MESKLEIKPSLKHAITAGIAVGGLQAILHENGNVFPEHINTSINATPLLGGLIVGYTQGSKEYPAPERQLGLVYGITAALAQGITYGGVNALYAFANYWL